MIPHQYAHACAPVCTDTDTHTLTHTHTPTHTLSLRGGKEPVLQAEKAIKTIKS